MFRRVNTTPQRKQPLTTRYLVAGSPNYTRNNTREVSHAFLNICEYIFETSCSTILSIKYLFYARTELPQIMY